MSETIARLLVLAAAAWVAAGVVFSVPFLLRGIGRIDPLARTGTPGFKLLVLPGVVALWPLLLRRWISAGRPPPPRTPHERAAAEDAR